jgi:hypothetical protein
MGNIPPFGSAPLKVQEVDGAPAVYPRAIKFPNTTLTDNGDGTVTYTPAAAGGGQSPYDAIVAASGGTHTTLGAAIAAASNGWKILVTAGTYTESAITSALSDLVIEGEGWNQSILSFSTNTLTLSGANLIMRDLQLTATTGVMNVSGAEAYIQNIYVNKTSTGSAFQLTGDQGRVIGCKFINSNATSAASFYTFRSTSANSFIYANHFEGQNLNTGANEGIFRFSNTSQTIKGNYFKCTGNQNNSFIGVAGTTHLFEGNTIDNSTSGTTGYMIDTNGAAIVGNTILAHLMNSINIRGASTTISNNRMAGKNGIVFNAAGTYNVISGNYSQSTAGTHVDFNNQATSFATVSGNTFKGGTTGINLGATDKYNNISSNTFENGVTTPVVDAGVANNIYSNGGVATKFEKRFLLMKNTSGGSLAAGDVVIFKAVAAGDEVTTTVTGGDNKVYGMAAEAISSTSYGMVQVQGFTTLLKADGTTDIAIGDYLTPFTTAKIAQKAAAGNTVFAIALEAYTTNDSLGVLDALIIPPRPF